MIAVAGIFIYQFFSFQKEADEETVPKIFKEIQADIILKGVIYSRSTEKKSKFLLNANDARFFHNKSLLDFNAVDLHLLPGKKNELHVRADHGSYFIDQERFLLKDNVVLQTEKGQKLFSDTLYFDEKKGLIWTQDPVLMKGEGVIIRGKGFKYDTGSGKMSIKQQTTTLESDSPMLIQ